MNYDAYSSFGISKTVYDLSEQVMQAVLPAFAELEKIREINQLRVIKAMQEAGVSESMFGGSTGYGYDDAGRSQIEQAYALAFGAESAYVRIQISAGTQVLSQCLFAMLRPGDTLLSVTGSPYDTLLETIGSENQTEDTGSLHNFGVKYRQVELRSDGNPDYEAIKSALTDDVKVVFIQKSRGYTTRRSLLAEDIKAICDLVHNNSAKAIVMVDNCYGEFVEISEPCMVGADLTAGSLIKNPGGGLSPSGGYVVGRSDLVEKVATRMTAPGLGSHVGPSLGFNRLIAQGFYLAPHVVSESLKGAVFAAGLFAAAGYKTYPGIDDKRGDIVQTLEFGNPESLVHFCQSVQQASPVDSFVRPEPWAMPGYDSDVIMAAGAFVQGASIELSADGPLKPPYPAYMQGGLCFENVKLACMLALEKMENNV
ncbi:MAG: methionine gamma-lyase family protein [Eubacteriales bacterium]|nr:methionine gamma-lyase family protein [Eubacteriales bacterium]MDD3502648.1 methionine gamma-lyase family protein [Eubacteriales bacterium]MDD4681710.1 methionine gamma-lyase family protein [Eubacteriales bacterium]